MSMFLSYNYTLIILFVLKRLLHFADLHGAVFLQHQWCYPLDSDFLFMGCVVMNVIWEYRVLQVFPLADRNAVVLPEKYKC